jgi:hypothetical protein
MTTPIRVFAVQAVLLVLSVTLPLAATPSAWRRDAGGGLCHDHALISKLRYRRRLGKTCREIPLAPGGEAHLERLVVSSWVDRGRMTCKRLVIPLACSQWTLSHKG